MYKEYMIRYPGYSAPLLVQMIDCITVPDVKLHKKTTTLIILYQCINNQMVILNSISYNKTKIQKFTVIFFLKFSHMNSSESDKFIKKIFQLFEQVRFKKKKIIH